MRLNVQFLHGRYKTKMVIQIPKKNIITVEHKHRYVKERKKEVTMKANEMSTSASVVRV